MFGFGAPQFDSSKDIPDLNGKTVIVTGGNSGIGEAACIRLAQHHAHVYLAARNALKAKAAEDRIKAEVPDAKITILQLDLASFASIHQATETFKAASPRLDILMNNAGVMAVPAGLTADGYEVQFGTNHMGHALLTKLLMPVLLRTQEDEVDADVRIINLSSGGHKWAPRGGIAFPDLKTPMDTYNIFVRYAHSKLANILFTNALATHYPSIKCIAVHPGSVETGLPDAFRASHPIVAYWTAGVRYLLHTPDWGAVTQLYCAVGTDAQSGGYYVPVAKLGRASDYGRDEKLTEQLWDWTEKELKEHGYA